MYSILSAAGGDAVTVELIVFGRSGALFFELLQPPEITSTNNVATITPRRQRR